MARTTHNRQLDHHGLETDAVIELSAAVDRYGAGEPLNSVLASLAARIAAMEQFLGIYSIDLHAVIKTTQTSSTTADAIACRANGSFPGWQGSFSADAVVI